MSKLTKLFRHPAAFFKDAVRNRQRRLHTSARPAAPVSRPVRQSRKEERLERLLDVDGAIQAARSLPPQTRFVYLPWIQAHGDTMFNLINAYDDCLRPLPLFADIQRSERRRAIAGLVKRHPDVLRRVYLKLLAALPPHVVAFAFSLDWNGAMRQAVYACKEVGLRTVLIPHEGMFANPKLYYVDTMNGADYPLCDYICAWGQLQADAFRQRGYPADRIAITGAPKFDGYTNFKPQLSREAFCQIYRLDPRREIILFAMQPLDSQFDAKEARAAQQRAIRGLVIHCRDTGKQLLVRCPPSDDELLGDVRRLLRRSGVSQIDEASMYFTSPSESIYHASIVVSVNSTMLFEAALLGRLAVSAKFTEFESLWQDCGGAIATTAVELRSVLRELTEGNHRGLDVSPGSRAARYFSPGAFDGRAAERVSQVLREFTSRVPSLYRPGDYSHLFESTASSTTSPGTVGFHRELPAAMKHVPTLLGFRTFLVPTSIHEAGRVDVFARWGGVEHIGPRKLERYARKFGAPRLILEDGFIRSVQIGLSGAPGLSVIIDDMAPYFDAKQATRLECFLNSEWTLTPAELERCKKLIAMIAKHRISKYNHAPDRKVPGASPGAVLVVDQRVGDRSVLASLAPEEAFREQLLAALADHPDQQILVKRHPDALVGGKGSYYADAALGDLKDLPRVHLLDYDVNPHALFDVCSHVYVVSSGMGFEALMRGLTVHCAGVPFYAGWGVTSDRIRCDRRGRRRSVEEIFFASYLVHSRYVHPVTGSLCDLEDLVPALAELRDGNSKRSFAPEHAEAGVSVVP